MLLNITKEHIDEAIALRKKNPRVQWNVCTHCPTALAIKDVVHTDRVSVNHASAMVGVVLFRIPQDLKFHVIQPFDALNYDSIKPGVYELSASSFEPHYWAEDE